MTEAEREETRERASIVWEAEGCPTGEDRALWEYAVEVVAKRKRDKRWERFFGRRRDV